MYNTCELLKKSKNIAIVGISQNSARISRVIADYLLRKGYNIFGVNPNTSFIDAGGITIYNSLKEIPLEIDIVDVFRKSEDIPSIVEDVISINPKAVWLQLGIRNDEAAKKIEDKGIKVIQDTCIKVYHSMCFNN